MSEPTTEAGRALLGWQLAHGWQDAVAAPRILAIEAEARQQAFDEAIAAVEREARYTVDFKAEDGLRLVDDGPWINRAHLIAAITEAREGKR